MAGRSGPRENLRKTHVAAVETLSLDALIPVRLKRFRAESSHYREREVEHGAHGYGEIDDDLVHQTKGQGQKVGANGQLEDCHGNQVDDLTNP